MSILGRFRNGRRGFACAMTLMMLATPGQAGTIVRVSTTLGDFSIDLLDATAPRTVANFLNYANRNAYNGNYVHRVVDNFVVQSGGYSFVPFVGPVDVVTDPPIANEFGASNLRGTVAMAKLQDQPDSATSQWFVNLSDNTSLDTNSGGFTVFGNVLGEGMEVLEEIDSLPTFTPPLGFKAPSAPYFEVRSPLGFVYMNVEVMRRFTSAPHVFESVTGKLLTSVDINDGADFISLNFNVVPDSQNFVIQANLESVIPRREFEGMATFSTTDNRFRIPTLEANINGSITLVNNVVFVRSSTNPAQFILESFDQ